MDAGEEMHDSLSVEQYSSYDDKDFCLFYYKAIKRLLDIDNEANALYLRRYFKIFNEYYDFWGQLKPNLEDQDETIINLLKDSLFYGLAFVYKNATLLSSAVAFHFRNINKISPMNIEKLITKKLVKICSLGGNSASDIVAIIKVLESIALKNNIELDFRVTIIESDARWKIICIVVLRCLEQFRNATWKITFIQSNPAKKEFWAADILKAIQEADIVTLIRFFSKFDLKEKIMKEICNKLQPRAVFFVLDHPQRELIDLSFDVTGSGDFETIYIELNDFHSLSIDVLKHFKTLYYKHFGNERPFKINLYFNVFISVWVKASPESPVKCKSGIEYLFQNNMEKYKPNQNFLSTEGFRRWENSFTREKEADRWSSKGIKKIVKEEKEKRNRLLVEFIDQKKKRDSLKNSLLDKLQSLKEEGNKPNIIDEESLEIYLNQKRLYSKAKKNVYTSSFIFY
ncbi:unnamed protein product [Larinioides sclopetarius]|uniref:Uncharacterized protein n=1 Tax=Larinioides sclopetarius TaxID=280406 RepID=A0AAV1ZIR9_9ARAC